MLEKYKTASPRFFALLIDGIIICSFVYLESFFITSEIPVSITIVGIIIYYICVHFYSIYLHGVYGQTLGKMAMKIKVLDIEGTPINLPQAIFRESPFITFNLLFLISEIYQILSSGINETFRDTYFDWIIIFVLFLWILAEIVVVFSNKKRRSIHDFIAKTVVIRTNY